MPAAISLRDHGVHHSTRPTLGIGRIWDEGEGRHLSMFERFTDRARRVVVRAQEEARLLDHDYIGTEHLLLGLVHDGQGVAAKVLESSEIPLEVVRRRVEEAVSRGTQAPSGHIPITEQGKEVLRLAHRESAEIGHHYIGTEHLLLGLIREGDGVAAQVLVMLGADQNRVRQQVIQLLHGRSAEQPGSGRPAERELSLLPAVKTLLEGLEQRLTAIEQRVGTGPDTSDLDEQIAQVCREKESAVDAQDFDQAVSLRDREKQLLADKATRQEQWAAGQPSLPDLAERFQQLTDEIERLRALLRRHGVDPEDKPA